MNPTTTPVTDEERKAYIALRNKPFADLTTDQKIGRLVEEVRNGRYIVGRVAELEQQVLRLKKHTHSEGKVVIDIESNDGCGLKFAGASIRDLLS